MQSPRQPQSSALTSIGTILSYICTQSRRMDGTFHCMLDLKLKARLLLRESGDQMNLPSGHSSDTYLTLSLPMTRFVLVFRLFMFTMLMLNCKSLNIIECPEFRRLLLHLQTDITDTMIPHRTKLHKLVIQAWGAHFQVLCRNLAVHLPHLLRSFFILYFLSNPGRCGVGLFYDGYVVR